MIAGVAYGVTALRDRLAHERIGGFVKKPLKIDKMLQIPHPAPPRFIERIEKYMSIIYERTRMRQAEIVRILTNKKRERRGFRAAEEEYALI